MIIINQQLCDFCGTCVGVCPVDAIIIEKQKITVKSDICISCSACVNVCPVDALSEDTFEL